MERSDRSIGDFYFGFDESMISDQTTGGQDSYPNFGDGLAPDRDTHTRNVGLSNGSYNSHHIPLDTNVWPSEIYHDMHAQDSLSMCNTYPGEFSIFPNTSNDAYYPGFAFVPHKESSTRMDDCNRIELGPSTSDMTPTKDQRTVRFDERSLRRNTKSAASTPSGRVSKVYRRQGSLSPTLTRKINDSYKSRRVTLEVGKDGRARSVVTPLASERVSDESDPPGSAQAHLRDMLKRSGTY